MGDRYPLVSIIIPTFNGSLYIKKSIESCLNQTYTNIELIIVNDCSTDDTIRIAEEFASKDDRIKIISNGENLKLPKSLNVGHNIAKGKFLTWHSDDNYYDTKAIKFMADYLIHNPLVDIVYADFIIIDENYHEVEGVTIAAPDMLIHHNCIGACFLYRREVYNELNGYDEGLYLAEDYDFWIRAYGSKNFAKLDKALYYYRKHSGSLTSVQKEKIKAITIDTKIKNLNIFESKSGRFQIAKLYREIINYKFVKRQNACRFMLKLFLISPLELIKLLFRRFSGTYTRL